MLIRIPPSAYFFMRASSSLRK